MTFFVIAVIFVFLHLVNIDCFDRIQRSCQHTSFYKKRTLTDYTVRVLIHYWLFYSTGAGSASSEASFSGAAEDSSVSTASGSTTLMLR